MDQSADQVSQKNVIRYLYEMYGESLGIEVVETIAENCSYNIEKAVEMLVELNGGVNGRTHANRNRELVAQPTFRNVARKPLLRNPVDERYQRELNKERIIQFIKEGWKVLILLRGLPGSGKSFTARVILQNSIGNYPPKEFILSADDFFIKNDEYIFQSSALPQAHEWNQRRCFSSMRRGVSPVIIDNTNLQVWEMRPYCLMAAEFGYCIEVLESSTHWADDLSVLVKKNIHGVRKGKILEMRDKYERNVTPQSLTIECNLQHKYILPQYRKIPPLEKPRQLTCSRMSSCNNPSSSSSSWNMPKEEHFPKKVNTQPPNIVPMEYIHTFGTGTKDIQQKHLSDETCTKEEKETVDNLIKINDERSGTVVIQKVEKNPSDDNVAASFNSFNEMINSFNSTGNTENVNDDNVIKTVSIDKLNADWGIETVEQKTSETNEDMNTNNDTCKPKVWGSTEKASNTWDILVPLSDQPLSPESMVTETIDTETGKPDHDYWSNWEIISPQNGLMDLSQQPISPQNTATAETTTSPGKHEESIRNKFSPLKSFFSDLKTWGTSEQALNSWEAVQPLTVEILSPPQPKVTEELTVETTKCEKSTNTSFVDFALAKDCSELHDDVIYLKTQNRNISAGIAPKPIVPPKKMLLDKSSMTNEEVLIATLNREHPPSVQLEKLHTMFPQIKKRNIKEIYEKCNQDLNWTVELLTENIVGYVGGSNGNDKEDSQNTSSDDETADVPIKNDGSDEDLISFDQNLNKEIVEVNPAQEKLKEKNELEKKELKKYLEESISIKHEYYSDYVWQLKSLRKGIPIKSNEQENLTLMQNEASSSKMEYNSSKELPNDVDNVPSSDSNGQCEGYNSDENVDNSDLIEINLGREFAKQLTQMFGSFDVDDFQPIVQMPESLAKQLHALYLESVSRQIERENERINNLIKEDEMYAKKLQDEETDRVHHQNIGLNEIMDEEYAKNLYQKDVDQWKNMSPDDLASRLTKQKLFDTFPTLPKELLVEILQAHNNNYKTTIETLLDSTDPKNICGNKENLREPPISDHTLQEMKTQQEAVNASTSSDTNAYKSASSYRVEANAHMRKRNELLQFVQNYRQRGMHEVAIFYSNLARKELQLAELANQKASYSFVHENANRLKDSTTLDLHFLFVKEALATLDIFLDQHILRLNSGNKAPDILYVITGRGKHSERGMSKLKPAVVNRLKKRGVSVYELNPGLLKIKVRKNLLMSTNLE